MARTIVAIAAVVWFGIGLFIREPGWVFLPFWGLYPGEASFNGSLSHLMMICAWVIATGIVFVGLAFLALVRKSRLASVAFIGLLLISAFVGMWRAV